MQNLNLDSVHRKDVSWRAFLWWNWRCIGLLKLPWSSIRMLMQVVTMLHAVRHCNLGSNPFNWSNKTWFWTLNMADTPSLRIAHRDGNKMEHQFTYSIAGRVTQQHISMITRFLIRTENISISHDAVFSERGTCCTSFSTAANINFLIYLFLFLGFVFLSIFNELV